MTGSSGPKWAEIELRPRNPYAETVLASALPLNFSSPAADVPIYMPASPQMTLFQEAVDDAGAVQRAVVDAPVEPRQQASHKALGAYYTDSQIAEFPVWWAVRGASDTVPVSATNHLPYTSVAYILCPLPRANICKHPEV